MAAQVPSQPAALTPLTPEAAGPASATSAVPVPGAAPIDVPAVGSAPKANSISNGGGRGRQGPPQGRKGGNMPHGNGPPHMGGPPGTQPRAMMVRMSLVPPPTDSNGNDCNVYCSDLVARCIESALWNRACGL